MDVVKEVEVTEDDTEDRNSWRWKIRCGHPWWEKLKEEEEEVMWMINVSHVSTFRADVVFAERVRLAADHRDDVEAGRGHDDDVRPAENRTEAGRDVS